MLKPGGHLFIRVPAFMWLWSSHDEELEVRYRYTREELGKRLERAGFVVEWTSYANGFLFPVILLRRFLKRIGIGGGTDVKPLPPRLAWLDGIFRGILASEANWFKSGKTPAIRAVADLLRAEELKNLRTPWIRRRSPGLHRSRGRLPHRLETHASAS